MRFLSHIGAFTCAAMIAFTFIVGAVTIGHWISDLRAPCVSIGGGCK